MSTVRDLYTAAMTYVISSACVDVMHKSCVQECPVDCIYEGNRSLYINPDECVDCGACKLACEAGAIYYETDLPDDEQRHLADNAAFFSEILPGRDRALGSPGGAVELGPANNRPGIGAVGSDCGVFRAGTPANAACRPLHVDNSTR